MNKIYFSDDEFDSIYESIDNIYTEKNAIEKEKDPFIQAKNRIKKLFKYNGKRGTITVDGEEHKITFDKHKSTHYNPANNTINIGGSTLKKWKDNDLKFDVLHELGHKKSININKQNVTHDNLSHYFNYRYRDFEAKLKPHIERAKKILKENKNVSIDDMRKQFSDRNFNDDDIKKLFKYARLSIKADKNNKDKTKEKISDYVNKKHEKIVKTNDHFDSEEAIADEFARKRMGTKNAKKALNRIYNKNISGTELVDTVIHEINHKLYKNKDGTVNEDSLTAYIFKINDKNIDSFDNTPYKELIKKVFSHPLYKSIVSRKNNKLSHLSNKHTRDDFNARKKLVKDKKFKELSKDLHKPQTVKESFECDKIQVLREAVEERFLNDELTYEEYSMIIERLDEKGI